MSKLVVKFSAEASHKMAIRVKKAAADMSV